MKIEWGQGKLEVEFLSKLRLFLERNPLDFSEFERLFEMKLAPYPQGGPYQDSSWGVETIGPLPLPFGAENSGHTLGAGARGATYSFIPSRGEKYLRIELFKLPRSGWTAESKLPCIQLSDMPQAFALPNWKRQQIFQEIAGVPRFIGDQYRYGDPDGNEILVLIDPRISTCVPRITVILPKMAKHPAATN